MAVSKAFMHFIRQRRILFNNVPLISSKTLVCVSFPKSQHYYYSNKKSLVESEKTETNNKVQVDFVEVVKDKTKFAWHLIIIAVGLSGVCVMFYYIFSELFSNTSPNSVYSKAFNTVKNDPRIIDMYGSSLKAFGDESGRRRRGHIRNVIFMKNGVEHMKMKFYIQGDNGKGTVHLEVRKNLEGQWVYRYLFVQLTHRPKSIIVLEDNRDIDNKIFVNPQDSEELMPPNWPNKLFQ